MILILTNTEDDPHTKPVIEKLLLADQRVFRFDVDSMTAGKTQINITSVDGDIRFTISNHRETITSDQIKSVWYRRPPHSYIHYIMYNLKTKEIVGKKIIILGEVHGVRENIEIIKTFIIALEEENISVTLALEWPSEINSDISVFLNNAETTPPWRGWDFVQDKDGRISKEHIALLQWLKVRNNALSVTKKHSVFGFSENHKSWNERDLKMAKNISLLSTNDKKKVVLAVMGNLHAQRQELTFDGESHAPLATHLPPNDTVIFKCDYRCGAYFNYTVQIFNGCKDCINENIFIKPSTTKEVDYCVIVPCAHVVSLLDS